MMQAVLMGLLLAGTLVPLLTAMLWMKLQERADRRNPLTERLQRLPGETLTERRRDAGMELMSTLGISTGASAIALVSLLQSWIEPERIRFNFLAAACLLMILGGMLWSFWKTRQLMHQLRLSRLGLQGERATAQALAPLLAEGWQLFHDIPGTRGNIDHVLVGPNAVFAIETKYRSKRQSIAGKESAQAEYDGQSILLAGFGRDSRAVDQAQAVAAELARLLQGKLGEAVPVLPVVALPGWFVKFTAPPVPGRPLVFNPKSHGLLKKQPGQLEPALRNRILSALAELASLDPPEMK